MLFDTDILIWIQQGHKAAAAVVENSAERCLSIQSYMELLQCANSKAQITHTKAFLKDFGFMTVPLSENIGHRALIYVEDYTLSSGLRAGDAIIAATAMENQLILCTSNMKHFKSIPNLRLEFFKPSQG